jgi:hypothetical protein
MEEKHFKLNWKVTQQHTQQSNHIIGKSAANGSGEYRVLVLREGK